VKLLVGRALEAAPPAVAPEHAVNASFMHGLTLLGYDAAVEHRPGEGGALSLTLHWQLAASEPLGRDFTVFLHLVDDAGVLLVPPADGPPLGGDWPTTAWVPERPVVDGHIVALPPALPPGRYNLRLGLYDAVTGERLAAYRPDGGRWPEDAVVIEDVLAP
jgi:hypothetical protein